MAMNSAAQTIWNESGKMSCDNLAQATPHHLFRCGMAFCSCTLISKEILSMSETTDPKITGAVPRFIRALQYWVSNLGAAPPAGTDLEIFRRRTWYHDFSALGLRTNFDEVVSPGEKIANLIRRLLGKGALKSGSHPHQHQRDALLIPMLEEACELFKQRFDRPPQSFFEPMGADGYYSFYAVKKLGFDWARCLDLEVEHVQRGEAARRVLDIPQVSFWVANVYDMNAQKYDIGLCSGGLYHVDDPELVLRMLRDRVEVLVVLTSVSHKDESPAYKISPVPGWPHGSAFSRHWLAVAAERAGWRIVRREGFVYDDAVFDSKPEGAELLLCV
jgi:hypothetical protein